MSSDVWMKLARFLKIPGLVRKILAVAVALVIGVMPGFLFSTGQAADRYMLEGDAVFGTAAGDKWTAGFGSAVLTPEDIMADTYYIAGYYTNNPAQGVLDDMVARAVYLDDNTGRGGVVLCAIDCVGISRSDINQIRKIVIDSGEIPGVKSINIAATHSHSAIDTQGIWGKEFYSTGRNKAFMENLRQKTAQAIIAAYHDRRDGNLYIGTAETDGLQTDMRTPVDYSKTLTSIRFAPADGSPATYMVNYACHPELLGKNTKQVSADFPAYMGREIERLSGGANFIFFNGAIGGMISASNIMEVYDNPDFDCVQYTMDFGKALGGIVMGIGNETPIAPLVNIKTRGVAVPCDNYMLVLARFLGVLNNDMAKNSGGTSASVFSEISYLELGSKQVGMFLIPGELYPELVSGNFLPAEDSPLGFAADYKVLSGLSDCDHQFVMGLCNDELGYIIPDNDFYLHEWLPYMNIPKDAFGREHYEETNSTGPGTARAILEAMDELITSAK